MAVPAAGTGGAAVSVSYRRFTQFLDRVGTKVGMSQENFTTDMRRQREPGVFHGLPQHLADKFENELDCYAWNLGAGKLYKVVQGFSLQDLFSDGVMCYLAPVYYPLIDYLTLPRDYVTTWQDHTACRGAGGQEHESMKYNSFADSSVDRYGGLVRLCSQKKLRQSSQHYL